MSEKDPSQMTKDKRTIAQLIEVNEILKNKIEILQSYIEFLQEEE